MSKIFVFSGSTRKESLNKKLAHVAADLARGEGLEVTWLDLKDYPLPIYNGDDEASRGVPDALKGLREIFTSHSGWIVSNPEYNASFTPLFKNTIDWLSRPFEGDSSLKCFQRKTALLLSASPGAFAGLRAAPQVRALFSQLGTLVAPPTFGLAKAHEAFDADGKLKDPKNLEALKASVATFASLVKKLD